MKTTLLRIDSDERAQELKIAFPLRVVSTNVDALRAELEAFWGSPLGQLNKWQSLELNLAETSFVDSLGLNMIFDVVKLAEARKAKIVALLRSRAVRLTFYTVRLDKRMEIRLIED